MFYINYIKKLKIRDIMLKFVNLSCSCKNRGENVQILARQK